MNNKSWNAIPRDQIKWHPAIDESRCIQCLFCVSFCKQGVYEENEGKPSVKNPLNCVVGCTECENICPAQAISHPPKSSLEKYIRNKQPESCCSSGSCCLSKTK